MKTTTKIFIAAVPITLLSFLISSHQPILIAGWFGLCLYAAHQTLPKKENRKILIISITYPLIEHVISETFTISKGRYTTATQYTI